MGVPALGVYQVVLRSHMCSNNWNIFFLFLLALAELSLLKLSVFWDPLGLLHVCLTLLNLQPIPASGTEWQGSLLGCIL